MKYLLIMTLITSMLGCNGKQPDKQPQLPLIAKEAFTATHDGKPISLYTLTSGKGITMQVTNFGARVVSLWVPDRNGKYEDIVLGYDSISRYLDNKGERFLGAVVGRYANRIAGGKFTIDGKEYNLPINNNGQTLHGGLCGLDNVVWNVDSATDSELHLSYTSPDGEDGFPGNLTIKMVYALTPDNEFKVTYDATTDKPTYVNLSHHSFFNLHGEGNGSILNHVLTLNASRFVPVNEVLIPTGELKDVTGTPFDFRTATAIGERINEENEQLKVGRGYDHNWVLDKTDEGAVELAATVYEPASGRVMEVYTDQPGIQFYSGNFFDGKSTGKYGKALKFRESLALETQKFPDSPHQPSFPSTRLNPGEVYKQTCIYKFTTK